MAKGPLTDEIVEFVATGVNVYVATRDRELEPEAMFAMGIRVHADRATVTVYLPEKLAAATRRNLDDNGEIAVTLERPRDHRGVQLKGKATLIRPSSDADRDFQIIFRSGLAEQLEGVGVPRSVTRRITWWPSLAVDVHVRDVFDQTPGPRAGEPMPLPEGER